MVKMKEYEIYCRVSTADQNVKQQSKFTRNWAIRNNLTIVNIVQDEESGRLPLTERTSFKKQLKRIKEKKRGLIIINLDRLTRNWDDVTYIEKFFRENWKSNPLISTGDSIDLSNASGRMMFRIKMAVNCFMPEDMIEKQTIGIDRARKEGKYKGGTKGRTWTRKK